MQVKTFANQAATPVPAIPADVPVGADPGTPVYTPPVQTVPVTPPSPVEPPVTGPVPSYSLSMHSKTISSVTPRRVQQINPASANVMQCVMQHPVTWEWYATAAEVGSNGTREPAETVVLSRMQADGTLIDSMKLIDGGHGTSFGLERVGSTMYIWLTYYAPAAGSSTTSTLVRFPYKAGTYTRDSVPNLTTIPEFDSGYSIYSFDWDSDLLAVRSTAGNAETYRLRKISEFRSGINKVYGTIKTQQGPPTLQGFCSINYSLFRYIGATNGENLTPEDPMAIVQYDWTTGARADMVKYPTLGQTNGAFRDGVREPESCTLVRNTDGTASLTFGITVGKSGNHAWVIYALDKLGDDVGDANAAPLPSTTPPPAATSSGFTLGTTKPTSSNSGAGVLRAYPSGSAGTKSGTQTLDGSDVLKGWTINGDVNMSDDAQLLDCIVHGRVNATGSGGNPLVENCVVDGNGDYGASAGNSGGDLWLLQSTMTAGYASFRYNTVKSRTVTYKINGIGYRRFHSYRNDVSQVVDGASITCTGASGVVMQGDYIHDLMFVSDDPNHSDFSHNDCLQIHSGTGTTIEGVNFEDTQGPLRKGTSPYAPVLTGQAIGLTCDVATAVSGLTVKNSWLSGGAHGFTAIVGNNTATNIGTLSNIRFGRNSKVNSCQISSHYTYTADGLTYEDNGAKVTITRAES